jgi:hypothetical protein
MNQRAFLIPMVHIYNHISMKGEVFLERRVPPLNQKVGSL